MLASKGTIALAAVAAAAAALLAAPQCSAYMTALPRSPMRQLPQTLHSSRCSGCVQLRQRRKAALYLASDPSQDDEDDYGVTDDDMRRLFGLKRDGADAGAGYADDDEMDDIFR